MMRAFLLKLFRRRRLEADLEAEMAFHREMAALHRNPIPLGNTAVIKEQAFDLWRFTFIENVWRDLGYAARSLRRSPGFVLSALLSLALGIGANTAIFSLATEFLVSVPSATDPSRLVAMRLGGNSHTKQRAIEFLQESHVFQDVVGENAETYVNWNDGHETRTIYSVQTTKNYFTALGTPVALGRGWSVNDPETVVVLSDRFWRKRFAADTAIVGRSVILDGRAYTVLGVLPESHRTLLGFGLSPDVYIPAYLKDTVLAVYARLKPGMSVDEARAAAHVLAGRLDQTLPERWKYTDNIEVNRVVGMAGMREVGIVVAAFVGVLFVLVFLVLLIACVNVASLLMVRASVRRQEIATRLSLGASRGRLLQQLLAESLLLSALGVCAGFGLAEILAKIIDGIPLPAPVPVRLRMDPDWRVAVYAAILGLLSTITCGLLPAWRAAQESLTSRMHRESRQRLGRSLVVGQIAVSVVVLAIGALFLRNLLLANATSPGFDVHRTLRAEVHLPPEGYHAKPQIDAYWGAALRELKALPNVETAAAARLLPFSDSSVYGIELTFTATGAKKRTRFNWNAVSPEYFRAMDIPLLAGREFQEREAGDARTVIVNRAFVDQYLDGRTPLGATFLWMDQTKPCRIVGVVAGTKNMTIGEPDKPQLYEPLAQIDNDRPRMQFVVRSAIPPAKQLQAVRQALRTVQPAAGVEVTTMYSSIGFAFLPSQIGAVLMGSVGVLGLLLAAIGLYGVTAYAVAQRTREIGIRLAIGAPLAGIVRLVVGQSSKLLLIGSMIGLACSLFLARPLTAFFVPGLSTSDPFALSGVVCALLLTGVAAAVGPARRAVRIDPAVSLREQ